MADTSIEWTHRPGQRGETWNPTTGCVEISPGCKNCYARTMHKRLGAMGQKKYQQPFHVLQQHPDALDIPLRARKPTTYFVNSMSDLFHKDVPDEFIDRVLAVMLLSPRHTFQILTKRADRMREYLSDPGLYARVLRAADLIRGERPDLCSVGISDPGIFPPKWIWWGVSVESQEYADERIPHLLETPAAVRFVSYEPALGGVDFFAFLKGDIRDASLAALGSPPMPGLDQIIVGGESGTGARPFHVDWARSVVRQCKAAGTACFVKQMGAHVRDRNDAGFTGMDPNDWPDAPTGSGDHVERDPDRNGSDGYQGAPVRIRLRDKKGGDMAEWPADLRVRQFPGVPA